MPKIFEYLGISIPFYSNRHEPVRVPGKYQGYEAKAAFITNGKITETIIKEIKKDLFSPASYHE